MLVVIGEDEAVGVIGEELEIEVRIADEGVEVEAQVAGVEVFVERGDKRLVPGLIGDREVFEVEGQAAVMRVGGEENIGLADEVLAAGGVRQEGADVRHDLAGVGVVIVDEGEDLGIDAGLRNDVGDLVFCVYRVRAGCVDDSEGGVVVDGVGGEGAVGGDDVEPLGEEESRSA